MDRNYWWPIRGKLVAWVATREGGVDRNALYEHCKAILRGSPPARVAWIETYLLEDVFLANGWSPPARVAWIETWTMWATEGSPSRRHPRGWRG